MKTYLMFISTDKSGVGEIKVQTVQDESPEKASKRLKEHFSRMGYGYLADQAELYVKVPKYGG